jgi:hypothetical protein
MPSISPSSICISGAKYQRPSTRIISSVSSPAWAVAVSPSIW